MFFADTVAPAIDAFELSNTCPVISPVVCACAANGIRSTTTTSKTLADNKALLPILMIPPPCFMSVVRVLAHNLVPSVRLRPTQVSRLQYRFFVLRLFLSRHVYRIFSATDRDRSALNTKTLERFRETEPPSSESFSDFQPARFGVTRR